MKSTENLFFDTGEHFKVYFYGTVITKSDPLGSRPRIAGRVYLWMVGGNPLAWVVVHPSGPLRYSPSYVVPYVEVLRVESLTEEEYKRGEGHSYPRPFES